MLACLISAVSGRSPGPPLDQQLTVVESLPVVDFGLKPIPGNYNTTHALVGLVDSAQHTLDITAMYWSLIASPDPAPGQLNPTEMARLGSAQGQALYDAIDRAAQRGVSIRVINGAGISSPAELVALQQKHPGVIQSRLWNATGWYGGGIMHQKVWIADRGTLVYIGSANMDWLSLAQVKELGMLVQTAPNELNNTAAPTCGSALELYERWWKWSAIVPSDQNTLLVFDKELHVHRRVPCWSSVVQQAQRCADPFVEHPVACAPADALSSEKFVLAASPREMLGAPGGAPETQWDLEMITNTIYEATTTVDLSVMDILPANMYSKQIGFVVWDALFKAIRTAVVTNGVRVRFLASSWQHTSLRQIPFLKALAQTVAVCHINDVGNTDEPTCSGSLEIKEFRIPGWNSTDGQNAQFMPYSRVNHAKYLVTEKRANIGTSNWQWGYFYTIAGMSLNTGDVAAVRTVQQIFDRDWSSAYATDL